MSAAGPVLRRRHRHRMGLALAAAAVVGGQVSGMLTVTAGAGFDGWVPQSSGTAADLAAVSFTDAATGHAVGAHGTIIATRDGGHTWTPQVACRGFAPCQATQRVTSDLTGLSFVDRLRGWAVGAHGTIVATADGGRTWSTETACSNGAPRCSTPQQIASDLAAVSFVDPEHGWAVGAAGTVLATADGGRTWAKETTCADPTRCGFDPSAKLTGASFADPLDGWVVGAGGDILYTADGGRTWGGDGPVAAGGSPPRPDLLAVSLTAPSRDRSAPFLAVVHAVGDAGAVYTTQLQSAGWQRLQGGTPFIAQASGTTQTLRGVWYTDPAHGGAVGDGGTILTTTDGGTTWTAQPAGSAARLNAVDFPDANDGFVVGAGGTVLALRTAPPPGLSVRQVVPQRGPVSGRLTVDILGNGFAAATAVDFGTIPADGFAVMSDTRIAAVPPEHVAGTFDVTVATEAGVSGVAAGDRFTFVAAAGGRWRTVAECPRVCSGPAVRLQDGRVLVEGAAGVSGSVEPTNVAELYDPANGTWTLAGATLEERAAHTATLLEDGRVLVTGGREGASGSEVTATAELYDPARGSWSMTGSMYRARAGHTSTLLSDGRVLVAGGEGSRTAELYDPRTGRWSPAGTMNAERHGHTATLLRDGRVLVVGGSNLSGDPTTELYDPHSNRWHGGASLAVGRVGHTATLLGDGRVLVAGGYFTTLFRPNTTVPYAELYDARTGRWSSTGPMAFARAHHTAVLLQSGRVLVVGGGAYGSQYCPCGLAPNAEDYDPTTGGWELLGANPVPREDANATLLQDGSVLVAGGGNPDTPDAGPIRDVEAFVPTAALAGAVHAAATFPVVLTASLAAAFIVLVLGGFIMVRLRVAGRRAGQRAWGRVPAGVAADRRTAHERHATVDTMQTKLRRDE